MLSKTAEMILTKKRNYRITKELVRISFGVGVNLTSPTTFKDSLRIINLALLIISSVSVYANWCLIVRYISSIPDIAESICTGLQIILSSIKLFYYLFTQRRFYHLLRKAQNHEILQQSEIFQGDFPISDKLKAEADLIMAKTWRSIRQQLMFLTFCIGAITSYYFLSAVLTNLYHQLKETPNYTHVLPIPGLYPIWEDKGMSFPYYHIQIFFSAIAIYVAGMGSISFDGLFMVLCQHTVGLIGVLNLMVENSTSPLVPQNRRVEYLRYCICHHRRVFAYVVEVEGLYKHISLSQFITSLIVLGIVLFNTSVSLGSDKVAVFRMVFFILSIAYEVIIYCYNGELLTSASEEISMAFYSCDWYNESAEFKEMLFMMIMRTQNIFYFNISWFSKMSLATMVLLFRTSGSYFLLLRNLDE